MSNYVDIGRGRLYQGDCLEVMKEFPSGCVDMVLCDLPYGTTACKWDTCIPFAPLWDAYKRLCKGAIVLTGSQPFTSALVMSNVEQFKYCWVWDKVNKFTGALNANIMPMLDYEDIAVFYETQPTFNKQLREGTYITRHTTGNRNTQSVGKSEYLPDVGREVEGLNPKRILSIPSHATIKLLHPTQKPIALFEYLIRTYTNPNMLVLDNCSGSGTTAIACENLNRRWVCIEQDEEYCTKSYNRIKQHVEELAAMPPPDPEGWTTKL